MPPEYAALGELGFAIERWEPDSRSEAADRISATASRMTRLSGLLLESLLEAPVLGVCEQRGRSREGPEGRSPRRSGLVGFEGTAYPVPRTGRAGGKAPSGKSTSSAPERSRSAA